MEQLDIQDIIKRNREFAKITNLSNILIELDILLQKKEDTLLDIIFAINKSTTEEESIILSVEIRKVIGTCEELKNFFKKIKLEYNIIPGITIKKYQNKYLELEKEAKTILENYKRCL